MLEFFESREVSPGLFLFDPLAGNVQGAEATHA
jgi:hypothetical protein